MLREVMQSAQMTEYPIVALVLFTVAFAAILAGALLRSKSEIDHAANLPLDHGEENGHV